MSTKTIRTNGRQVAHLWAQNNDTKAKASNFFCEGDSIYSYGYHFKIARHVNGIVLYNGSRYSATTAKHQSYVRRAASHLTVIEVPSLDAACHQHHEQNLAYIQSDIVELAGKAKRARQYKQGWINQLEVRIKQVAAYCAAFGLEAPDIEGNYEALLAEAEESRKRQIKENRERQAIFEKAAEEAVAKWKRGEEALIPYGLTPKLRAKGEIVQTSLGAEVPYDHAKKAYRILAALRAKGETYHRNGTVIRVGHFEIDNLYPNGNVQAGCHTIQWEEIADLAVREGWDDYGLSEIQPIINQCQ